MGEGLGSLIFWWESCSFLAGVGGPFPLTTRDVATGRRKGPSRYANFEGDLLPSGGLHPRLGLGQNGERRSEGIPLDVRVIKQ